MATPEKLTVVGTLEGITEKPTGWTSIAVSVPGKNYPVKMETKLAALIEKARAAGTAVMEWTYTESDSGTPNPNKPGTNYTNRRFEGVGPTGGDPEVRQQAEASLAAAPSRNAQLVGGDKDRAITRMACLKAAAETLNRNVSYEGDDPALEVMKTAQRYENWVMRDIGELPEALR